MTNPHFQLLVVDDNPLNRKLMRALVNPLDCSILEAETAADALQLIATRHPDVIITDLYLPDTSGDELVRAIRESCVTCGAFILTTSASLLERDREMCLAAGSDAFLRKPIEQARLLALIQGYLADSAVSPPS